MVQHLSCVSCLAIAVLLVKPAMADPSGSGNLSPSRFHLHECAWLFHWPGGALFHTAFHGGTTTRFLLLKACARSEPLKSFLDLTADQLRAVQDMKPVEIFELPTGKSRVDDPNAQPDEQIIDPNYYSYLTKEQLLKLDLAALRYDGYWALTRDSLASRVSLSPNTRSEITDTIMRFREGFILPKVRSDFAAPLPKDHAYEKMLIAGSLATHVNLRIVDILTDAECIHLSELIREHDVPEGVLSEVRKIAELPHGLSLLNVVNKGD